MKTSILALILSCMGSPVPASVIYESENGVQHSLSVNSHGAILTSSRVVFYLGNDCDVISSRDERGYWSWSNAGFAIAFPRETITFERQDAPIANAIKCRD